MQHEQALNYVFENGILVGGYSGFGAAPSGSYTVEITGSLSVSGTVNHGGQLTYSYAAASMTTVGWYQATTWLTGRAAVFDTSIVGAGRYAFMAATTDGNFYVGRTQLVNGTTAPSYAYCIKSDARTAFFQNVGIGSTDPLYKLVVSNGGAEGFEFLPGASANLNVVQHYNRSTGLYVSSRHDALQHQFLIPAGGSGLISSGGVFYSQGASAGYFAYNRDLTSDYCGMYKSGTTALLYNSSYGSYLSGFDSGLVHVPVGLHAGSYSAINYALFGYKNSATEHPLCLRQDNTSGYIAEFQGNAAAVRLRFPEGGGIEFPGAQAARSHVNTLDDYEEGSVNIGSGTANVSVLNSTAAYYVKIGQFVMCSMYIEITNSTGASIGACILNGLPFACNGAYYGGGFVHYQGANWGLISDCYVDAGTANLRFSWSTALPNASARSVMITLCYRATA